MDRGETYRMVELVGTSTESIEEAIQNAVTDAGEAGRKLDWFEVRELRGFVRDGRVGWYQVRMGIGYRVE